MTTADEKEKLIRWSYSGVGSGLLIWSIYAWIGLTKPTVDLPFFGETKQELTAIVSTPVIASLLIVIFLLALWQRKTAKIQRRLERIPSILEFNLKEDLAFVRLIFSIGYVWVPITVLLLCYLRFVDYQVENLRTGQVLIGWDRFLFYDQWWDGNIWRWKTSDPNTLPSAYPGIQPILWSLLTATAFLMFFQFLISTVFPFKKEGAINNQTKVASWSTSAEHQAKINEFRKLQSEAQQLDYAPTESEDEPIIEKYRSALVCVKGKWDNNIEDQKEMIRLRLWYHLVRRVFSWEKGNALEIIAPKYIAEAEDLIRSDDVLFELTNKRRLTTQWEYNFGALLYTFAKHVFTGGKKNESDHWKNRALIHATNTEANLESSNLQDSRKATYLGIVDFLREKLTEAETTSSEKPHSANGITEGVSSTGTIPLGPLSITFQNGVVCKVEFWVSLRIRPEDAPKVVARFGQNAADRAARDLASAIKSYILAEMERLTLEEARKERRTIENNVLQFAIDEGKKRFVTVIEVGLGQITPRL